MEGMADFDSSKMDNAADEALAGLETIGEEYGNGVKAIGEWIKK